MSLVHLIPEPPHDNKIEPPIFPEQLLILSLQFLDIKAIHPLILLPAATLRIAYRTNPAIGVSGRLLALYLHALDMFG